MSVNRYSVEFSVEEFREIVTAMDCYLKQRMKSVSEEWLYSETLEDIQKLIKIRNFINDELSDMQNKEWNSYV